MEQRDMERVPDCAADGAAKIADDEPLRTRRKISGAT